jgi:methylenetetrahydrofolate reductase (NADPH)
MSSKNVMKVFKKLRVQNIKKSTNDWSIEITPAAATKIENFADYLPANTTVNVTCLPGSDPIETIKTAEQINNDGMVAVPHLAARSIANHLELDSLLKELSNRASVNEVLIIGGGGKNKIGEFSDSMSVLRTGLLQKNGITKVGVAGHPEGSADISNEKLKTALFEKNEFAKTEGLNMYIETQFCFDSEVVLNWERRIRADGNKLPIHIGIPGPATIKALFRFARLSGIGNSMSFLTKQARNVTKLLTIQSPDSLLSGLSEGMQKDADCLLKNFHFYPFGGFSETVKYINSIMIDNTSTHPNREDDFTNKLTG